MAGTHYPDYDPKKSDKYDRDDPLYAERFCSCGGILRVRARAEQIISIVETWEARHWENPDEKAAKLHEPTDKQTAWEARVSQERAAAAMRGEAYEAKKPANLDVEVGT